MTTQERLVFVKLELQILQGKINKLDEKMIPYEEQYQKLTEELDNLENELYEIKHKPNV